MILYALIYFLNGISLAFFITAGMRMFFYARRTGSRPHLLFAICLGWMALIQVKEFFCNFIPFYNYEVLGPAFTFPDLFTLPLLSLFFFELVMPGRINLRYALRLLAPFALLGGTYLVGLLFFDRTVYLSLDELIVDLPALLPATLLLYVVYAAGYCIFAFIRIVRFSLLYTEQIAQAYSFTERIHLRWMRWMAGILAFYLISYIGIIAFTTSENYIVFTFALSLAVWGVLYGCVIQYRIPKIILNYWRSQPAREQQPEENVSEKNERIEALRAQVAEAIDTRRLYLNPGLTIVDMAAECGTNRTHLSQFFNNELGLSFRDYINHCRIQYAALPLLEDEEAGHKIEEVALLSGFGSTATFYRAFAKENGSQVFVICAQIEEEISELDEDERKMFLEDLGLTESGLEKLVRASYHLLGLMSFLTAGEDETRAWTIKIGTKAPQAAGKIHTDFERGFIKAEVVNYQDLLDCGSYAGAREKGLVRMEGKEYVVQDGDVILFRFNV